MIDLPEHLRRSRTWNQGGEMAQHARLRIDPGLTIYFCDPHGPWQRGTNENTNGLLRQYFPRGTDLDKHSVRDLAASVEVLPHAVSPEAGRSVHLQAIPADGDGSLLQRRSVE